MGLTDDIPGMEDFLSSFDEKDFLHSRNKTVAGNDEVALALKLYQDELEGNISRKKFSQKKVKQIEGSMTLRGVKKLSDVRKTIRMRMQASERERQRQQMLFPIVADEESDLRLDESPLLFMKKMQIWGEYDVDDRRYYLHMVFRFYLKEYHDEIARKELVIPHPSYQYVLDALYPCESASKFPPEFRQFLRDAAGRHIEVRSLPVPVKGSSNKVTYDHNFEAEPQVSTTRMKIESITRQWKTDKFADPVYPRYLWRGDPGNVVITKAESLAQKIKFIQRGIQRLGNVDLSKVENFCDRVPAASTMYEEYSSYTFKTTGEQLRERLGFFTVFGNRKVYYSLQDFGLVEDLFEASRANIDILVGFQTFCSRKAQGFEVILSSDDSLCRSLLMVIVDVSMFFYVVRNRAIAEKNPLTIVREVVTKLESV